MKKVLMISYYAPPAGGGGVQRVSKFIKYLPVYDWQPLILTAPEDAYPLRDLSLLADLPPGTQVYPAPAWRLPRRLPWRVRRSITRWFLLVDEQIGWLPGAVRQGMEIIRQDPVDAIFSTAPPYTAHLIAQKIQRRTQLPWIADFRDPWIGNFSIQYPTRWHQNFVRAREASVVRSARQVISVSQPIQAALQARYPALPAGRFVVIPNGYDPQDFENPPAQPLQPQPADQAEFFSIVYTGSLYGARQTAEYFLRGLRQALDRQPGAKIRVHLVGNLNPDVAHHITSLSLAEVVHTTGYQAHSASLAWIRQADALLLIVGAGAGMEGVVTGKVFEYLAAQKPILALVPAGSAADLVRSARAGVIVPPQDVEAICSAVLDLYAHWEDHRLTIEPDLALIQAYNRRFLTGKLAALLDEVIENPDENAA